MGGGPLLKCFPVGYSLLLRISYMEAKPMDCKHLRYPTVEQLLLIEWYFEQQQSVVCPLSSLYRTTVQGNCYFRAEKTKLRKRRKKDRNMQVPLPSSWLLTEGKYKEKMFPLVCLDSINYIPVISTPNRNLMLLLNKKHR